MVLSDYENKEHDWHEFLLLWPTRINSKLLWLEIVERKLLFYNDMLPFSPPVWTYRIIEKN